MVKIRLRRVGSKNQSSFRIIAADKESPRDGRFLENLGHYNPRTEPATVEVDEARLFHWMRHGARPSDSVRKILTPLGTWDRWERFKAGEELDTLLEEARASTSKVDPRTRRDDLAGQRRAKKTEKKETPSVKEASPAKAKPIAEEPSPVEERAPVEAAEEEMISEPVAAAEPEETGEEVEESTADDEEGTIREEEDKTSEEEVENED
ncbi:MAG: 30S ribosomal protein S16 [Chloroflexi bacterium RBG_16_48_8]|nr:MAG: 30S ribosomal protein S16 [Chloroflexi bacterium RBG_16_48_8]